MACVPEDQLRVMDRRTIRLLDHRAIHDYGVPGIVLMENAACGATEVAMKMLAGNKRVLIVCGGGNNGGDGWAMARHLMNAGADVSIHPVSMPRPGTDAATNADICHRMRAAVTSEWPAADLVVDALLGTGLDRPVEGALAQAIDRINAQDAPTLAIDLPSGLDADLGTPLGCAVRARATATFAAWKPAFLQPGADQWTGEIHTIDIGAPGDLTASLGAPRSPRPESA